MSKLSILIPARNEIYLQRTVEDLLEKAKEDIEIIVTLDGYWPDPILPDHPKVILVHNTEAKGLRSAVNNTSEIANGQYIMKIDAHCMVAEGFDRDLKNNYEENSIVVPTRYSLDAENWKQGYGPIEYLYLTFPYISDKQFGEGLHGKKWLGSNGLADSMRPEMYYYRERERKDKKVDDIQTIQGSCWFMSKQTFLNIGKFDPLFGKTVYQEAQEMCFKVWLSGGRICVNKHTWYAHWHKDTPGGYGFSKRDKHSVGQFSTWYWMNNKWPQATRTIEDFIEFHWPMPGWPEDWKEQKLKYEQENNIEAICQKYLSSYQQETNRT
jgi:glycosyltransferase involved in cell wall biosynthesis